MTHNLGNRVWKTKDGTKMRWRDMTPTHLRNCAAMLERNLADELSAAYSFGSMLQGEMATYEMDRVIDRLQDSEHPDREYAQEMRAYADQKENGQ